MSDETPDPPKKKPPGPSPSMVALVLLVVVVAFWAFKQWKESRVHTIVYRALSGQTCRIRLQGDPPPKLDPIEQQTGVLTPWEKPFEAREGQIVHFRVYGDASCTTITCEVQVDGIVISRKTVSLSDAKGVDSASCEAMAVNTSAGK